MDIQEPNNPKQQQQQLQQNQIEIEMPTKQFVLGGQLIASQQVDKKLYDSSVFMPTSGGLVSMYAGFPTSTKANITTLVRFGIQYLPAKNDLVIGVVKIRTAQTFIVDIAAPMDAILGGLQFDGATKRNKPNLKVGSVVFCRVVEYSKYMGGKLSCINKGFSSAKKTNEMGQLKQGYVFWVAAYKHQTIQKRVLQRLGKCVKFEVAFGKNGRIWVNSSKVQNIMLIGNIFKLAAENADEQKINAIISMIK